MYLLKVYRQWKALFFIITTAMILQAFFMFKGIENVPFFLYSMFATTNTAQDSIEVYKIKIDGQSVNLNQLSGRESEMLLNNLPLYVQKVRQHFPADNDETIFNRFGQWSNYQFIKNGLINTEVSYAAYPAWFERYVKTVLPKAKDSVIVSSSYIHFLPSYSIAEKDSIIFRFIVK